MEARRPKLNASSVAKGFESKAARRKRFKAGQERDAQSFPRVIVPSRQQEFRLAGSGDIEGLNRNEHARRERPD
jgi:hypothetical protein